MAAKGVSAVSTLVLLSIITRTFGEAGTGVYTLALTYLAFFYLAADMGLNGYFLAHYGEDGKLSNELFNFRLVWSIGLVLISLILLPFFSFSTPEFIATVVIGGMTIVLNGIFNSTNFIFQYNLAYSKSSIATAVGSIASLTVAFLLSSGGVSVEFFAFAPLSGWLVTVATCLFFAKKFVKLRIEKPNWLFPLNTFKKAWPVAATLIINTVYFRIDSFILSANQNFSVVGSYNLAYQLFQDVLVLPAFIMNAYYPIMLVSLRENVMAFKKQFINAFILMGGLGLVAAVGVYLLSPFAILFLTGGGFESAVKTLNILSFSFPAFFLSALLIWLMMAKKLYKQMFVVYLVAFMVNLLLNIYLIPWFSFVAAAWVTVFCEYLILILQILILLKYRKGNL